MLLMDRHLGKPPFKGQIAFSDGSHKTQKDKVVQKLCAVIPSLGIMKLAVMTLPYGERGYDEKEWWGAIDFACRKYAEEHEEFKHYLDPKLWPTSGGLVIFRPGGFCQDAAGELPENKSFS